MKKSTAKKAFALTLVLAIAAFELVCAAGSLAESSADAEPPPEAIVTPEVERVVIESDHAQDAEIVNVTRPEVTINQYQWPDETLRTMAKFLYSFDTFRDKFLASGVVVNRVFCGMTKDDGTPYWGDGTVEGTITKRGEFEFYNPKAKVTEENLEWAEFMLDVHATRNLTKKYTGYIFPSNVIYLGWTADGQLAAYVKLGGKPFIFDNTK
jgi:hypothetical protein